MISELQTGGCLRTFQLCSSRWTLFPQLSIPCHGWGRGSAGDSDSALRAKKSDWRESQGLPGDENVFKTSQRCIFFFHAWRQ